ncbi:MAG: sigma-70 domain-containing protein [Bilifractor sp.]
MKKNMTPEKFREKLQELLQIAAEKDGHIAKDEAADFFREEHLSDEQMNLVYSFLLSRGILVEGYDKDVADEFAPEFTSQGESGEQSGETDGYLWTEEDQAWLEDYRRELEAIPPEKDGEWERLVAGLKSGDRTSGRRMSELLLPAVVEEAKKMYEPGLHLSDLIQEGSLQLVLYIDQADPMQLAERDAARQKLIEEVHEGILAMLEEQREVHTRDQRMVERVEELKQSITNLKEQLGRKVYVDELAEYMHISEDEVEDILRLAGENVPDDTSAGSGADGTGSGMSRTEGKAPAWTMGKPDRKGRRTLYNPAGRIRRK